MTLSGSYPPVARMPQRLASPIVAETIYQKRWANKNGDKNLAVAINVHTKTQRTDVYTYRIFPLAPVVASGVTPALALVLAPVVARVARQTTSAQIR